MGTAARQTVIVFCVCGLLVAAAGGAFASFGQDDTYTLSSEREIAIPDRTVAVEGDNFTVGSIVTTKLDSTVSVTADGPNNADYSVYLYNRDEQIVATDRVTGSETVQFDLAGFSAGVYTFAINGPDGEIRTVLPLIIEGYEITASVQDEVTVGESVTISASVSQIASVEKPVEVVEIGIINDGKVRFIEMRRVGNGQYQAQITFQTAGTRDLFVGVRGGERVDGELELLGLSTKQSLRVIKSTPTPTATEPPPAGGGGSTTPSPTPTETPTPSSTQPPTTTGTRTPTQTPTETPVPTTTASPTPAPTMTAPPTPVTTQSTSTTVSTFVTQSPSPTQTTANIVTPVSTTATTATVTETTTPLPVWLAPLAIVAWGLRRVCS